jgi:hypothetical protein
MLYGFPQAISSFIGGANSVRNGQPQQIQFNQPQPNQQMLANALRNAQSQAQAQASRKMTPELFGQFYGVIANAAEKEKNGNV